MKELLQYIKEFNLRKIFIEDTENTLIQFIRYCFVGGVAFIVDWLVMILLAETLLHYLIATAFGFVAGLVTNYTLSKKMVFKKDSNKCGKVGEFTVYAIIGVMGLGLTELLMYLFTDKLAVHYIISKIIVAAIVLVWNFFARKLILYKR